MADDDEKGPDNQSSDYQAMADHWVMVEAINGGADAMRAASTRYLPKFPNESAEDYTIRKNNAPFTNIYSDVSRNLASKPFSRELILKEGASKSLLDLCEDIDGQGNNLHVFGADVFQRGLDDAIDWILVDYPEAPPPSPVPRSQADEKALGLRPYWVQVPASKLLAVYSDFSGGNEVIIHARIYEPEIERDEWKEKVTERVRVFDRVELDVTPEAEAAGTEKFAPATFTVYEKQEDAATKKVKWATVEGPKPVTIGIIPLVPFMTGKRKGTSWVVKPPLRDIAHLQVEEFQQESNIKTIMELTCFPMLSGNGVEGKDDKGVAIRVPVGPRAVLFAPMSGSGQHGSWTFVEPSAQSIEKLMKHLEDTQKNMRDLGMQPLTTANLTVITTANVATKAHSAVEAWALALKDAFEQAFKITNMWLKDGSKDPEVEVFTDFGVDFEAAKELDFLTKCENQGILSKQTVREEAKRRGVLSDNFDLKAEEERIAGEQQGQQLQGEQPIDPVTGLPIVVKPPVVKPPPVAKLPVPPPTVQ